MQPITKVPGIEFDFGGGRVLVLPPLSLNAFKQLQQRGADLAQLGMDAASLDTVLAATHSALSRNYPSITIEEVGELVDLSNITDVMTCVLDVSGLKRKSIAAEKEAAAAAGKAPVATTTSEPLTGTPSSPESQPTSA